MTISGYAWGPIVASGPHQLEWDTREVETHPRPLDLTLKQVTVLQLRLTKQRRRTRELAVVTLRSLGLHPFRLEYFTAFPHAQG